MAQGKALPDATRAAVMAALLTGQSVTEISREFQLPKSSVSRIKSTISSQDLERIGTEKQNLLEDLVLDYVTTNLQTLKAQSIEAGKPEYIKAQPASELAVLHGVLADKTFRILSALEPRGQQETN